MNDLEKLQHSELKLKVARKNSNRWGIVGLFVLFIAGYIFTLI